jgi:hypothetical protein
MAAPFAWRRVDIRKPSFACPMVALDHSAQFDTPQHARPPFAVLFCGALAVAALLAGLVLREFSDEGVRLGTLLVWRLGCLVFFAALVAGPLGRLIRPLRALADKDRPLLRGFCTVLAVYLVAILLPNLLAVPGGIRPAGITAGMVFFVAFTGGVTLVMATALHRSLCRKVGRKACRAMLGVSVIYFWLCYGLIGLAHISGPHRPDVFYELSVILMVTGLLVRFAERFIRSRRPVPAA